MKESSASGRREVGRPPAPATQSSHCVFASEFRQNLLAAAAEKVGPNHYSVDRQETNAQKAETLVQKELHRRDWAEADLSLRPKGDRAKVATARRLRNEPTMTLKGIAHRLHLGSWTYVSNLLGNEPT